MGTSHQTAACGITNFENLTRTAFLACFDSQPSQAHPEFPLFAIASDKRCARQGPTCVCPRRSTEPSQNKSTGRGTTRTTLSQLLSQNVWASGLCAGGILPYPKQQQKSHPRVALSFLLRICLVGGTGFEPVTPAV